ncbi:hypothetical protein BGX34_010510 [Mortierella sp. NVP85]|nr:hypothetical protein BGX34_010510 [Mortierella sp. NVP85]
MCWFKLSLREKRFGQESTGQMKANGFPMQTESLPQSSRLQVKTRLEASGLNDARRARALAEAEDSDAQEEEDELEVLDVKEPMEETDVIEVEDAVACMGTLSMDPEQGD